MLQPIPFDLRSLEVFLAVCDGGGMAAAARRLGVSQPSVSQTIYELETRTGTTLFDRSVRPIGLTRSGTVLRQRASMLVAEARQIGPLLRDVGQGRLPFLRLGMVDSLSRALTAVLARALGEAAVQSSILSGLTSSHAAALLTRQLDIVLAAEEVEDVEGLERHLLYQEQYVLICPDGMPIPEDVADLARLGAERPLLRFSARSRTGIEVDRHLRRLGLAFDRHLEFDTPFGVAAGVAAGLGWAITTPLCVQEASIPGVVAAIRPLPGPPLSRRLVLIAREREFGPFPGRLAALCRSALDDVDARGVQL